MTLRSKASSRGCVVLEIDGRTRFSFDEGNSSPPAVRACVVGLLMGHNPAAVINLIIGPLGFAVHQFDI